MKHGSLNIEIRRRYDEEGKLIEESQYVNGLRNGKETLWFNDIKIAEAYFRDGKLDGKSTEWDEDGNVIAEIYFKDDEFDGPYITRWDNGNIKEKGHYINGKRTGLYYWYRRNGEIWAIYDFDHNKYIKKTTNEL